MKLGEGIGSVAVNGEIDREQSRVEDALEESIEGDLYTSKVKFSLNMVLA